ncbi:hypothetical protein FRC01_012250 [Tulasnella sp. 417]|nr:hypothetical protein FRC01_012250 [Tulasnella sp. 417]
MESQSSISLLSKFPINIDPSTQQDGQGSDPEGFEGKASFGPPKEWTSRPARHGVLGFLPTVIVLVVTLGFAGLILGVLLGRQCPQVQGGHGILAAIRVGDFVTSEEDAGGASSSGHLRVLTLSALASHLISDTSSILMTLVAYRVGASWLRHSKTPGLANVSQNPTPRQYGLLLRLMGSSSILAVAESCFYTVRLRKRARLPRMFREALAFAVLVWVLSRLVGLIDLWLHTASSSSLEYVPTVQPSGIHMFGVAFNQSLCADLSAKYPEDIDYDFPGFPCSAAYVDFVRLEDWGNDLGFMVMTNSTSAPISIVTMEDNVLVAVPGPPVGFRGYAFTAPTFAVHANCESINHICQQDQQGITVNCTAAGYPQLPYVFSQTDGFKVTNTSEVKNRIFGVVDGRMMGREIGSTEVKAVTNNPTTMAIQLRWDPPEQGMGPNRETHSPGATNMTELAIETFPKPTLYASCSVSYLEAVVRWDGSNGSWSLLNTTLAAQQRTATLWLPVVWQFATEQLASNLMNVARTRPRGEVMAALNQELARLALG